MRILLDNCTPYRAKGLLASHDVFHARDKGWQDLSNGLLLTAAAQAGFDIFITTDKNIRYQQNLAKLPLSVVELDLLRNRIQDIQQIAAHLPVALEQAKRFNFVSIDQNGRIETLAEHPRTIEPPREPPREPRQPERDRGQDHDIER